MNETCFLNFSFEQRSFVKTALGAGVRKPEPRAVSVDRASRVRCGITRGAPVTVLTLSISFDANRTAAAVQHKP